MRNCRFLCMAWLCVLLSMPALSFAQVDGHGFAEGRASVHTGTTGQKWQLVQRVRPTFQMDIGPSLALVATVEAGLSQGRSLPCEFQRTMEESDFGPLLEAAGCRWPDKGHRIFRVQDSGDYLDVDRLYLDLYRDLFDLRLGRQSIDWGSAQFFHPTDPFPEVLLTEPWRPRRGINAARATVPFGSMHDVMVVGTVNDALDSGGVATRVRMNLAVFHLALVGAMRGGPGDTLVGLDLRGTNVIGWWAEGALFPGVDPHTELAVGIDYSFPVFDSLLLFAQYYRNGAGQTHPDRYGPRPLPGTVLPECDVDLMAALGANGQLDPDRSPFAPVTRARDYLLVGAMLMFMRDFSFRAFMLQNLNDGTAMAVPTFSFVASDRVELSLSGQLPFLAWGDGGEFRPRAQDSRWELQVDPEAEPLVLDLSGLIPTSTITLWARFSI